jgi:two-component system, OmpR family, response regulator
MFQAAVRQQWLAKKPADVIRRARYNAAMSTRDHILIVDDDPEIRSLLCKYLDQQGYRATAVGDGKGLWAALDKTHVDLVVLDLMLPGEDGLVLCRKLRAQSELPVIVVTARGEETERIIGLEMGADDYLPKPFNPRELLARIKGVLRRTRTFPSSSDTEDVKAFRFANWALDTVTRQLVSPDSAVVALSSGEYRLLRVFLEHPNRVLSRDQLLDLSRGREQQPFDRSIDVMVSRLRRALRDTPPAIIQTVRAEGYVLSAKVETER